MTTPNDGGAFREVESLPITSEGKTLEQMANVFIYEGKSMRGPDGEWIPLSQCKWKTVRAKRKRNRNKPAPDGC